MNLFNFLRRPRVSHRNDPTTSVKAEDKINTSGSRESNSQKVLSTVTIFPKMTAPEISIRCGLDETETRRRLSDLKTRGLVQMAGKRLCNIKGTEMSVWEVVAVTAAQYRAAQLSFGQAVAA